MIRKVLAVLAATAAAPSLVLAMFAVLDFLPRPGVSVVEALDRVLKAVPIGAVALLVVGGPLLVGATILAVVLEHFRIRRPLAFMLWGAATGLASASLFGNGPAALLDNGAAFAAFSLAGAICGFIYWRIGVRGVPAAPPRLDPVL